jgi:hypothetical protein
MEATMPGKSSMHSYLSSAKERIDEMDAALASLERSASRVQAGSKARANQLTAELKKRRDEFQTTVNKQAEAGEAALERARTQLETQWSGFEAQVKAYVETVGKEIGQQQATFLDMSAAQMKAWREATEKLHEAAGKVAAARRVEIEAAFKRMKADASEAEARMHKLKQAGSESCSAWSAALAESRKAFDRANQAAWDAVKRAAPPKS